MEIIRRTEITSFANSGVTSEQLLFPENSASRRATITRVTVASGAKNPPHVHPLLNRSGSRCAGAAYCCLEAPQPLPSPRAMLCASWRATSMVSRTLVPASSCTFRSRLRQSTFGAPTLPIGRRAAIMGPNLSSRGMVEPSHAFNRTRPHAVSSRRAAETARRLTWTR